MSSNLFTPSLRYTNKETCNSAWTFIDGQNVSDIEVPKFIKNLFTSFDDSRYGKMGKDLIEGAAGDRGESCIENPGGDPTCNGNLSCIDSVCINNVCEQSVCSGNNVLIDPLPTLGAGVSPDDSNCCVSPPPNTCATAYGDPTATGVNHPCNVHGMEIIDKYSQTSRSANPPWYGPIDSPETKDNPDTSPPGITTTNYGDCCTASKWPNYCEPRDWSQSDMASWTTSFGCYFQGSQ